MNYYVTKQLRTIILISFEFRPRKATPRQQKQRQQKERRRLQNILEMLAENRSKHIRN